MSDISQVDGQSVRLKREALGWASTDLATLACLSVKQIKQIEEGGTSAFYSENVKLTAARKVAALLQMTEDQLFGQVAPPVLEIPQPQTETLLAPVAHELAVSTPPAVKIPANEPSNAALMRSEALHFLAQPPEDLDLPAQAFPEAQAAQVTAPATADTSPDDEMDTSAQTADAAPAPGGGNYIIKIFALFLVAIAVAALLRPKAVEEKAEVTGQENAAPAPPPIQVPAVPAENQSNLTDAQAASNTVAGGHPVASDKPTAGK